VNDLRRCRQISATWNIDVRDAACLDYDKRTPLHVAAAEGAYSVVEWLLSEGVELSPVDRHNRTPLEARPPRRGVRRAAARPCLVRGWRAPLPARPPPNATHPNPSSAHLNPNRAEQEAVRSDHQEVVRLLAARGAVIMEDGQPVGLEQSRLRGLVNMRVSALLEAGFDPEWEVNPSELTMVERIGASWFFVVGRGVLVRVRWVSRCGRA